MEQQGETVSEGRLTPSEAAFCEGLQEGVYDLTVEMGDGVMLASLNDYPSEQFTEATWQIAIAAGEESLYRIELRHTAALSGSVMDAEGAQVTVKGGRMERAAAVEQGVFSMEGLYPDTYTVALSLPAGEYAGEGWQLTQTGEGVQAVMTAVLEGGQTTGLPALTRIYTNRISGTIVDEGGQALSGASIALLDEQGMLTAQVESDASGAWSFDHVLNGSYTVRVLLTGETAAADRLVRLERADVEDVQLTAARVGSLTVSAFRDANDNGNRGKYETYLPGVQVTLYLPGDPPTPVASGVTGEGEGGAVVFKGIPAGEYFIRTVVPDGYGYGEHRDGYRTLDNLMVSSIDGTQDSELFPVEAGDMRYIGVGALPLCTVSGAAWVDLNSNGVYEEDEPGLAGVEVSMIRQDGQTVQTVTDADGAYTFSKLRYGRYDLKAKLPTGKMFTIEGPRNSRRSVIHAESVSEASVKVALDPGDALTDQLIGVVESATISGTCFLDADYNGVYDADEAGLEGVKLTLLRANGTKVAETNSAADGSFTFSGLRGGTYGLKALLPDDGTIYTRVDGGALGNRFVDQRGSREQKLEDLTLEDFAELNIYVGAVRPGSVSGSVYFDDDFSGAKEASESAVNGLTVTLLSDAGAQMDQTVTDANGAYNFTDVMPGAYRVAMTALDGYAFTKLGEGNVIVNTGSGTGRSEAFRVELGGKVTGMDVGLILPGVVEGVVYADVNDNGTQDTDETGLLGAVVRLMEAETGEAFAATIDESGSFCFDAVMPGTYFLRYELPGHGVFCADTGLENDGSVGETRPFALASGDHMTAAPQGGLALADITGVAFDDANANGTRDAGESTLPGVTLRLARGEEEICNVVSDELGQFALTDLRPGDYQLTLTFPDDKVISRLNAVTLPIAPGLHEQTVPLKVNMGDQWLEQQLGAVRPASLSGRAWMDENGDGLYDPAEAYVAGESLTILDDATGETLADLMTDETGMFSMTLVPGSYTLIYELGEANIMPLPGDSSFIEEDGRLVAHVTVELGASVDDLLLGIVKLTQIGGQVWHDSGESVVPLQDAMVTLMNADGEAVIQTLTGEDGSYCFDHLEDGQYQLSVMLPEGHVVVTPDDERLTEGGLVSVMTDCRGREAASDVFTLRMGEDRTSMDIGSVLPGRLGDRVWLDENANGLQDLEEGGIPNILIELVRGEEVVASAATDQYGFYFFRDLYPGVYTLRVTYPADILTPTLHRLDFPAAASVLLETGESVPVSVPSDNRNYNADVGFQLVTPGVYPEGYGQGAQQDWTHIGW